MASGFTVVNGGVANWQDRTAGLVAGAVKRGELGEEVYVVTGTRVMDTKSDKSNPNVQAFHYKKLRFPTETEYAPGSCFRCLTVPVQGLS